MTVPTTLMAEQGVPGTARPSAAPPLMPQPGSVRLQLYARQAIQPARTGRAKAAVLPGMSSFASEARQSHWAKRPGIREEVLKNPGVVDGLIDALDELYGDPAGPVSSPAGDPEP